MITALKYVGQVAAEQVERRSDRNPVAQLGMEIAQVAMWTAIALFIVGAVAFAPKIGLYYAIAGEDGLGSKVSCKIGQAGSDLGSAPGGAIPGSTGECASGGTPTP